MIIFIFHNFLIDIKDDFNSLEVVLDMRNININEDENIDEKDEKDEEDQYDISNDKDSITRNILFRYIYWKLY
jgi:hypothetical protein